MRFLVLLLVWIASFVVPAVAPPLWAQTLQPGWIADSRTGCRVWNGTPAPGQTVIWTGGCQNTLAQGRGEVRWFQDGKQYLRCEAEFRDGARNGRVVCTWATGERYEGEYRDDMRNGRGVATFASGNRYEGDWRDDMRNGRGVATFANGNRYEGEYRDDMRNGRGVFTFADGDRYEGNWHDNKPNGFGALTQRGEVFSGTWTNGCFQQGSRRAWMNATEEQCGFR